MLVGCDCLGLIRGVWREIYGDEPEAIPAYSPDWAEAGPRNPYATRPQALLIENSVCRLCGRDVLLFRWKPHFRPSMQGLRQQQQR
jgi:NlpC/P60 family putative phage cell wall peptidase